jgi:hypothetical protein
MRPEELTDKAIDFMFAQGFEKLSAWETSFVESVEDQWTRNRRLSDRQKEILGNIWDKQP